MDTLNALKSAVSDSIKEGENLAGYTSFKIGGPAKYFYAVNSVDELVKLVAQAEKLKVQYLILGGGSNLLINDSGYKGLVIKINFNKTKVKDHQLECDAGVFLSKAVGEALATGLTGLEWAIGIPGLIGGAVSGNAGAFGGEMSDSVSAVKILRNGKIKNLDKKKCGFGYRQSIFNDEKNKDVILSVVLDLKPGDKQLIKNKMDEVVSQRKNVVEDQPNAGSVFKNIVLPESELIAFVNKYPEAPIKKGVLPVAWLVEQCGLKGKKIGGAMVSESHAGRIVNTGKATAENVIMLISVIKQKVRDKFGIQLMEEIEYVGF